MFKKTFSLPAGLPSLPPAESDAVLLEHPESIALAKSAITINKAILFFIFTFPLLKIHGFLPKLPNGYLLTPPFLD
jgi:hypothetical protein